MNARLTSIGASRVVFETLRRLVLLMGLMALPAIAAAQEPNPLLAVDTTSPQATMRTFQQLTYALETAVLELTEAPSYAKQAEVERLTSKLLTILDLSEVPPTGRRDAGRDAFVFLVDVLRRIDVPPLESIPDAKAFPDPDKAGSWTVPGSEITISRVMQGPKKGRFLFDAETVARAGEYYDLVKALPLKAPSRVESWREGQLQLHGWMVPGAVVSALPKGLKLLVLDTPAWKVVATLLILGALGTLLVYWGGWSAPNREEHSPRRYYLRRLLLPAAVVLAVGLATYLIFYQINAIGTFARIVEFTLAVCTYAAGAWAAWLAVFIVIEWIIESPKIGDKSLDANLLRLLARILGLLALASVAAYGAQQLGLPVIGVVAGLGVGGLAVALAAQSSIENIIGGLNLYADRPIRVGDFCEYAGIRGHVEQIGLRSTRIRGLDRTVTSVPNSVLAKVHVTNYALRDQMLFRHVLDLRNDTTTDQLRALTNAISELLATHPKVRRTISVPRVHVIGFGEKSIKVEIHAYLDANEIPKFLAIQEELTVAIIDLVRASGTALSAAPALGSAARTN